MEEKPKRVMSEEALAKLAVAREKANKKRQELAEQRRVEKESLIQEKIEEVKQVRSAKVQNIVEKEAKKRLAKVEPKEEAPKAKRESIVIERDSSDSDEDDFRDARAYFVRKDRKSPIENTSLPNTPRPITPDPHAAIYNSLFGGSNSYL